MSIVGPPGDYTNLNRVRTRHAITSTSDNTLLLEMIRDASKLVDLWSKRSWLPYQETKEFGPEFLLSPYELHLRNDLLSVTTLTNADGSTISASEYFITPRNAYPKHFIKIKDNSGVYFAFTNNYDVIQIDGLWGAHNDYDYAWVDSNDNVPGGGITSGSTTLTVTSNQVAADGFNSFSGGTLIKIESEFIRIVGVSATTATIQRGVRGTTAAAHTAGVDIYVFRPESTIEFATDEIVKWMYEHRDEVQSGVQLSPNLGVIIVNELPEIYKLLTGMKAKARRIGKI